MITKEELQRIVASYVDSPMLIEELWHSLKPAQQGWNIPQPELTGQYDGEVERMLDDAEQPAQQQVPERMKPFVQRHHITSAEFTAFHVGFCCGEEFNKQPAQQQEPVEHEVKLRWNWHDDEHGSWTVVEAPHYGGLADNEEMVLYTSPQPQRKPLTDEQCEALVRNCGRTLIGATSSEYWFARGIRAAEDAHDITGESK